MQTDYQRLLIQQRAYFATGVTKGIDFRLEKLKQLKEWIKANDEKVMAALKQDLGKGAFEAYSSEIMGSLGEINLAIKNLHTWARPRKVKTPLALFKARSEIIYEPFGTVLVISPWNYPFSLSVTALVGVIAAGNCCVVKPSEISLHTSKIIVEMIQTCFEEAYCAVVEGNAGETMTLLKERFDFIHFTGSTEVGKVIALAAAQHLTPVVLELGGESPCIIDETADVETAARRICWGKFMNAGQTCVAPDYVVIHKDIKDSFIKAMQKQILAFYGEDPQLSEDYARIINEKHFDRLCALLSEGEIVWGGQVNKEQLYIAPTVMNGVSWDHPIMRGEIFGPILPVLAYEDLQQLVAMLKTHEKPLALYLFSKNKDVQRQVMTDISFGGGCVNATVLHIINGNLPFGGVGSSGMGNYHGKWSFETFSHKKSILNKSLAFDLQLLYPPYKKGL